MDLYVINPHHRQVAFQHRPMPATIERGKGAEFSAEEEQILIARVLTYHPASDAGGEGGFLRFSRFAQIGRNENVSAVVISTVSIKRRVNCAFRKTRWNHAADVSVFRNAGNFIGYVLPGFP